MSNICPPESSDREVSAGKTRGRKKRGLGMLPDKLKQPSERKRGRESLTKMHVKHVYAHMHATTYATFPKRFVRGEREGERLS